MDDDDRDGWVDIDARDQHARLLVLGKLCCLCECSLTPDPAHPPGQRYCPACAPGRHRALLNFQSREGWHVHFLEPDCRTPVGRPTRYLRFAAEADLRAFVLRCSPGPEDLATFEQALRFWGRGSLYVHLSDAQYRTLQ